MGTRGIFELGTRIRILVFALCCLADLFVLRTTWTGRQILEGQFRRGYFEQFDGEAGLAVDNVIRPIFPSCVLGGDGKLAVPPGMSAVVPLGPGAEYALATDSTLAPYVVVEMTEAPVKPVAKDSRLRPGEARLVGGRTFSLREGRLALIPWNPSVPWREDATRLSALHEGCVEGGAGDAALTVSTSESELRVEFGRCSLRAALPAHAGPPVQLAALAGPDWITVTRRPQWAGERWIIWPLIAVVIAKVAITWWGAGIVSAAALSGFLAGMALVMPVPATLTWPLTLLLGVAAAVIRAAALVLRWLPSLWRLPAVFAVVALVGIAVVTRPSEPRQFPPVIRVDENRGPPDACAVVGYSSAGGASLRGGHGGLSVFLDRQCAPCRDTTGQLSAGGETLEWARDAYCASESGFGKDGHVIFFGGANDDFLSGLTSMARLFIVGDQGIEPWRQSQAPAAAASLARLDSQTSALEGLMQCVRTRHADFLFLHDFLVTDMSAGREGNRAVMLARRRAAVEESGGTFVDLFEAFRDDVGISWFNDYVHPSAIAHERFGELACRLVS